MSLLLDSGFVWTAGLMIVLRCISSAFGPLHNLMKDYNTAAFIFHKVQTVGAIVCQSYTDSMINLSSEEKKKSFPEKGFVFIIERNKQKDISSTCKREHDMLYGLGIKNLE